MAPVKRINLPISVKYQILNEVSKGVKSKTEIAIKYEIPKSTLSTILKAKEKILNSENNCINPSRKRRRDAKFPELEEALVLWLKKMRAKNVPIDGNILKEQADTFALRLSVNGFKGSDGWVQKFKLRHGLTFKKLCGESSSVDKAVTNQWIESRLKDLLLEYAPDDVFNADETGLVFKLLPERTFTFKGETCHGGKHSKERVTVMLGANMSGTEKLPLVIIGKSKQPRCFKNIRSLPATYTSNKKAWMTAIIFQSWVRDLDRKFAAKGRKILLLVDNCTAHSHIDNLKAIHLEFFPPNATSILQPMDQGIIHVFKRKYRKSLLKRVILNLEHGKDYVVDLLAAIHLSVAAWNDVSQQTVANCFQHAGFKEAAADGSVAAEAGELNIDNDDDIEGNDLLEVIKRKKNGIPDNVRFSDFCLADNDMQCTEDISDDEIILQVSGKTEEEKSEDEDTKREPRPTGKEAASAVALLRRFFEDSEDSFSVLGHLQNVENALTKKHVQQSKITGFFRPKP